MESIQVGSRISKLPPMALTIGLALCAQPTWADPAAERQARLEASYRLDKPDGNGPFPAVMLVPGCSGFHSASWKAHFDHVAQRIKEAGFNALDGSDGREPAQVAALIAYYPIVGMIRPWEKIVPALVLCGEQDVTAHCERLDPLLPLLPGGKQVKVVSYPETAHGFDNSDLPAETITMSGNPMGYNAAIAPSAWSEAEKFLHR